jgi:hypothetical protein
MFTPKDQSAEQLARQAQHECGHAAVSWTLGIPFARIMLRGPQGIPIVEPQRPNRMMIGQLWLIQCCGAIADQQRRGLRMRDSQILKLVFGDGADDTFEVDDVMTGQIVVRPSRVPAVSPGGDLHNMAVTLPTWPNAEAECIRVWRGSENLQPSAVPRSTPWRPLLASAELRYDKAAEIAAAAMKGKPEPVIPEWARR